jgi:long-chain acyl-CoA synthetase
MVKTMSERNVGQIMRANCEISPEAKAIEFDGVWYDWAFVSETIESISNILGTYDVPKDAEIALLCRNKPHQVAAFSAVICAERCVTPINPFASEEKIVTDLDDLEARVVIASASDWESSQLRAYADKHDVLGISLDEARDRTHISVCHEVSQGTFSSISLNPDVAVLMQSSGTTGKPKRIPMYASKLTAAYSNIPDGRGTDKQSKKNNKPALITQPLVHIGGLFWIIHSLLDARPISLLEKFDVEKWAQAVERYQIRVCSLVPAMINMVLESDIPDQQLSSLICIRSGTAPLTIETQQEFEKRFNVPILTTYGATEFAGAVCGWTLPLKKEFGEAKVGSVGRAYEGTELRITDQVSNQVLGVDETGILQVKASQMLEGDGWIATTDLASIDEDGFIWLKGRADAAINRGGFKIIPTEVAAILERNDQVKEACVVGIDDKRLGQVPVAAVELAEGVGSLTEDALKAWAKENMTSYFVPVKIAIVDSLPRTPSMKVSQAEVRRLFEV